MGELFAAKEEVKRSPVLSKVPKKEYFFPEDYILGLRSRLGIAYGDSGKKANCVTFPLRELEKISEKVSGEKFDRGSFRNGGRLLELYSKQGGSAKMLAPESLLAEGNVKPGNLILAIQKAANADEIKKHFEAGDYAVWQDKEGNVSVVKSRKEAEGKLKDKSGRLCLTKHYLTFADNTEGRETVIHASRTRKKTVEQKLDDFLEEKVSRRRSYIVVDLEVAYPALASNKKEERQNEFLASSPDGKKRM